MENCETSGRTTFYFSVSFADAFSNNRRRQSAVLKPEKKIHKLKKIIIFKEPICNRKMAKKEDIYD